MLFQTCHPSHEPPGEGTGPTDYRPGPLTRRLERFMVPMPAEKRKGALHELHKFRVRARIENSGGPVFWRFGDAGEPTESARGPAQSKTLQRDPQVHDPNACGKKKAVFP